MAAGEILELEGASGDLVEERDSGRFWETFWAQEGDALLGSEPSELLGWLPTGHRWEGVLEVGVGDGRNLAALARNTERVEGIDLSSTALARAAWQPAHKANLQRASGLSLPYPDSTFDLVVASDVVHHLARPRRFVEEVLRVLLGGGIFLANTLSVHDPGRDEVARLSTAVAPEQFRLPGPSHAEGPSGSCTMAYYNAARVAQLLQGFSCLTQPKEYERRDPPHPPPFKGSAHTHVCWLIMATRR